MEAARCYSTASSLSLTLLQFVPSVCVFCSPFHVGEKSDLAISLTQTHKSGSSCTVNLLFLCVHSVSNRIFSLHVPLASKTLVSLIYKPSAGITVSLELKTTDASLCTHIQDVKREFLTLDPLSISAYPLQGHHGGLEPMSAIIMF